MIKIGITTDTKGLDKKIDQLMSGQIRALQSIGRTEVASAQNRIAVTKTAPDGTRWDPMAFSTIRQRTREGNVHLGLLNRTGALLNSIYSKVTGRTLEVGSRASYAQYQQNGTNHIPARPFIGWSENSINRIKAVFVELFK
jgi:phage gpG-like protein